MKKKEPLMIDVSGIDWELLREQKAVMLGTMRHLKGKVITDVFDGVISLIDDIQDQAAEEIGEKKVFGKEMSSYDKTKRCETCGGTQYTEDGLCPECGQ